MSTNVKHNTKRICFCGFDYQVTPSESASASWRIADEARKAKVISFCVVLFLVFNFFHPSVSHAAPFDEVIRSSGGGNDVPVSNKGIDALVQKEINVIPGLKIGGVPIPKGPFGNGVGKSLDSLYWNLANLAIHEMSQSIIRWIQTGRHGKPLFITNWKDFLLDVGNEAGGHFIDDLGLDGLCEPFTPRIQLLLGAGGSFQQRARCTIADVVTNTQNFYRDFRNGGWDQWFQINLIPSNSQDGAYFLATEEKLIIESGAVEAARNEGLASGGILGMQKCYDQVTDIPVAAGETPQFRTDRVCDIVTPGHVVQSELEKVLNLDKDKLVVADELDEILGVALTELFKTLRSHSKGLLIPEKGTSCKKDPKTGREVNCIEKGLEQLKDTNNDSTQQTLNNAGVSTSLSDALAISGDIIALKNDSVTKLRAEINTLKSLRDCLTAKPSTTDVSLTPGSVAGRIDTASSTLRALAVDIQNQNAITSSINEAISQIQQGIQQGADSTGSIDNAIQVSSLATAADLQNAQDENDQITADKSQAEGELSTCHSQ